MSPGRKFRLIAAPHVMVEALRWIGYNFVEMAEFTERRCFLHRDQRRKLWVKEPDGWHLLEVGCWVIKRPGAGSVDSHGFVLRGFPPDSFTAVYEPVLPRDRPPTRWVRFLAWIDASLNPR